MTVAVMGKNEQLEVDSSSWKEAGGKKSCNRATFWSTSPSDGQTYIGVIDFRLLFILRQGYNALVLFFIC